MSRVKWGWVDIILVYALILILTFIFGLNGEVWFDYVSFQLGVANNEIHYFIFSFIFQFIITIGLVIFFAVFLHNSSAADLGVRKMSGRDIFWYGIGGGIFLIIIMILLGIPIRYFQPELEPQYFEQVLRSARDYSDFIPLLLAGSVLAPLSEELFFRGMVYSYIRQRVGIFPAVLIAGLIFGLAHFDLWRIVPLTAGGAILCFIYDRTGSILTSALAHGIWNGIMALVVFLTV